MLSFGITTLALLGGVVALPAQVDTRQLPFLSTPITDFAEPWALAFLPDDRILVTEKAGQLRLVNVTTAEKGTITGVPPVVYAGQGGFGDVALHPKFTENQFIYISYVTRDSSTNGTGATVARAKLALDTSGGGALQDLKVIWEQSPKIVDTGMPGHFGHRLVFGPDGALWISSSERQQFYPAQNMSTNLGKMLKLNDDGTPFKGNPFHCQGALQSQIWSLGHRNILGFDFDSEGRLWESEMGPLGGDELNLVERAANYGYPYVSEGRHYNGTLIAPHSSRPEFVPPKIAWTPVIAPADMIIYKGDLFSAWKGNAIIAALGATGGTGLVRVELTGDTAREAERYNLGVRTRAVRASRDGAIYTLEDGPGGRLVRHTPN